MLNNSVLFTFPTSLEIACHTKIYFVIAVTNLVLPHMQVISITSNAKEFKELLETQRKLAITAGRLKTFSNSMLSIFFQSACHSF